jgi:hypothetical protein
MSDEVLLDGPDGHLDVTPARDLIMEWVAHTVEVRALELAQRLVADGTSMISEGDGMCVLVCDTLEVAESVYSYLDARAEELLIVPEASAAGCRVYAHSHIFTAL